MASIQISIKKGVYEKLKALKAPEDSFSDVIERLIKGQPNLQGIIECYGIFRDHNDKEIDQAFQESRQEIQDQIHRRLQNSMHIPEEK